MATVGVDFDLSFLDITTTVKTNAAASAKTIDVTTSTGMAVGDAVAITLDDADVHWDIIASVTDSDTIVITTGIPSIASAANVVKSYNSYMCRSEGNRKMFSVTDSPLLPPTLITGTASTDNIQPERGIITTMKDWRKGFQQYLLEDAYKYYDSENCDARLKEKVTLPPKRLSAVTFPVSTPSPTIDNADFEDWTGVALDDWTEEGGSNHQDPVESSEYHSGSACVQLQGNNNVPQYCHIYQDLTWNAKYKNRSFTVTGWGKLNVASASDTVRVGIDDGVDITYSSTTSTASWAQVSATKTLSNVATRLRVWVELTMTRENDAYYSYADDIEITLNGSGIGGSTVKIIEFGDDILAAIDDQLYDVQTQYLLYTLPETITDLCVFENNLYIAQGWSAAYWYTSDLITFTESTLTGEIAANVTATRSAYAADATAIDVVDSSVFSAAGVFATWGDEIIEVDAIVDGDTITAIRAQLGSTAAAHATGTDITELSATAGAKHMANVGGSQFWISDSNSTMRVSGNPINSGTAFSTAYQIGNDDHDITGLVNHADMVFCRKEDDLYYLSGSDVISLLDLKTEASTTYTYPVYTWGGNLYIPSGINSLYEYNVGTGVATTISPTRYAIGDADYDEDIIAMAGDETYLYCAIDNGSDIKILAGRWENVEGDTDWYWHPLYTLASHNDITSMLVSSLSGSKRLYVGTDTYGDGVQPYILPIGYAEPYTESGYECEASGTFYTPWLDGGFPTEEKYWKEVDITTICCTDKTSIVPYYQVKGGSWTAMTTCTTSAYDGGYPDETTDTREIGVSSERIRFKFALAAAVDEYTPILFGTRGGISVKGVLQSERKRQINAQLLIADRINERTRTTLARTVSTDLTNLRTYYAANDKETIVAPDDTEYNVTFDRESYREDAAYDETMHKYVWWVSLKLLEV